MKKLAASLVAILLIETNLWAQGPARIYTQPAVPSEGALDRLNLKLAWRNYLPTDGRRDGIYSMQILPRQLLVQLRSGRILSLNSATGAIEWSSQVGLPYAAPVGFGSNSQSVFVAKGVRLYALDRITGALQWELPMPNAVTAAPSADEEFIYVPFGTDRLLCMLLPKEAEEAAPVEGAQKPEKAREPAPKAAPPAGGKTPSAYGVSGQARESIGPVGSRGQTVRAIGPLSSARQATEAVAAGVQPQILWEYQTEYPPETRLEQQSLLTSQYVFEVGASGLFFALSKLEPKLLYRFQASAPVSAPLGQFGDIAYVASEDYRVYALDIETGRIIWRFVVGGPIFTKPRVTDENIYVSTERNGLYSLDRASGEMIWRNLAAHRFLAVNKKFVYTTDRSGRLMILDRARGTELAIYDGTRDFAVPLSNELTDRVFLASQDGLLLCLHDRDYPKPLRVKHPPEPKPTFEPTAGKKAVEEKKPEKPADEDK